MLLSAAEDFNIDLFQSWLVGNGENDIEAGVAVGCNIALIGKNNFGQMNMIIDFWKIGL